MIQVKIEIDNRISEDTPRAWEDAMQTVAELSLTEEGYEGCYEVSISLVDNEEICTINHQYRNINRATDVLSFPLLTFAPDEVPTKNEEGDIMLGDIILSVERAEEQAEEYGHSMLREVAFLTTHSMFHLLGYDHMTPEEEAEMMEKQTAVLERAGILRDA